MCGCNGKELEIDRYIGLPIFKHFTIIGFVKKKKNRFWFFFFTYIIIQSITSSEILFSAFDPSKCAHTWSSGHTHTHGAVDTHTHTHTWSSGHTHTHTHTWNSGHCSLRRSSSTATACNFIQDSLVWNTLNYINIYYRTIISPINI